MTLDFATTTTFGTLHNPGYDYLMGIYWMKDAQSSLSSDKTRFFLPAKALLSACLAIESYVNLVGSKVDPQWDTLDEKTTPIEGKLTRIHKNLRWPLDLNRGVWADVLLLFSLRQELSRFELAGIYGMPEASVPRLFKEIERDYPIRLTHAIAEEAIDLLLTISEYRN